MSQSKRGCIIIIIIIIIRLHISKPNIAFYNTVLGNEISFLEDFSRTVHIICCVIW